MPLDFDDRDLLPEGIHDASLDEIDRAFGNSSRRGRLIEGLKQYVASVRQTGWSCEILIDGSFVMPKVNEPNDIDVILVLPDGWDLNKRDFRPFEYNTLDRGHTKRALKIEVYPVLRGSKQYDLYFKLFSDIRIEWCEEFSLPRDARKGLVRVAQ